MPKPLIALPCTARELEVALHRVCDHDGTWDGKIRVVRPPCGYWSGHCELEIETETKGENP